MPSNPNIKERLVRIKIEELIESLKAVDKGVNYNTMVWEILKAYPVSEGFIDRNIKRFFIDRNIVKLENGIIYFNGGKND